MRVLTIFSLFLASISLKGAVFTVNNVPGSNAQYSTATDAMNAASPGDTIYLSPSGITYGAITLTKRIVLMGAGTWPEGQAGKRSITGTIVLSGGSPSNPQDISGSVIKGLQIAGCPAISTGGTMPISDIIVEYNFVNCGAGIASNSAAIALSTAGSLNSWILRNNLGTFGFYNWASTIVTNWLVSNNVMQMINTFSMGSFGINAASNNNVFSNNIIRVFSTGHPFKGFENATIINNIIFGGNATTTSDQIQNCTVSHNLFFGDYTLGNLLSVNSNGVNNILGVNVDPGFVEVSQINNLWNYAPTLPFTNFNLQLTSPAKGAGTNGIDLGIYSGSFPWLDNPAGESRRYYPGARIPEIYNLVSPGVASPNGTLQIQINARNAN